MRQDDIPAAVRFYEMLGLTGSVEYKLRFPAAWWRSLISCTSTGANIRWRSALGPMKKRIKMLEYTDLDDLGVAHDIIRQRKIDVALQLGKHSTDEALTFYCANPSGWLWELGWGAKKADNQQEYYSRDIFGHGNEAAGYGMDIEL